MNKNNNSRAARAAERFQIPTLTGPSPAHVAARCQVSIATAKRWLSGKARMPHHALVLLSGELGAMSPQWRGWHVEGDTLVSPKGWMIGRDELVEIPRLLEELATLRTRRSARREIDEQPLPD